MHIENSESFLQIKKNQDTIFSKPRPNPTPPKERQLKTGLPKKSGN